jgi:hypothetical protein
LAANHHFRIANAVKAKRLETLERDVWANTLSTPNPAEVAAQYQTNIGMSMNFGLEQCPGLNFFSVQPLCLCGHWNARYNNRKDTENAEVAQRKSNVICG